MNHVVAGKPGGGKGRLGIGLIVSDLIETTRPIITDIAVEKLPWVTSHRPRRGLLDYLDEKHGDTFNASERVFRLEPSAMFNFFLYRALNNKQVAALGDQHLQGYREVTKEDNVLVDTEWQFHHDYKLFVADHEFHVDKRGRKIVDTYDTRLHLASGGHWIGCDEAWKQWPARGWSNTGEGILHYYSLVRRFGDDNFLFTQRFGDCDSILVDRCQDFWLCTNHGKMRFGAFKQPDIFRVQVFDHRPTATSEPQFTKNFTLDKHGLAECYDTSGGVGVAGRVMADIGHKTKGLPLWVLPVAGILMIWLAWQGVKVGKNYISAMFSPHKKTVPVAAHTVVPDPVVTNAAVVAAHSGSVAAHNLPDLLTNELFCVGYTAFASFPQAYLSDGTTVEPPDLELIGKNYVVVHGVKLPVRKAQVTHERYDRVSPGYMRSNYSGYQNITPAFSQSQALPNDSAVQVTVIGENRRQSRPQLSGFRSQNQPLNQTRR